VRNIVMLSHPALIKGQGWGCVECGLPCDGAIAVVCDGCLTIYQADQSALRFFCLGYPASLGRVSIADLPQDHFDHDNSKHGRE
jgi:hypothetical protein